MSLYLYFPFYVNLIDRFPIFHYNGTISLRGKIGDRMKANRLLLCGVGAETELILKKEEDILVVGKVRNIQDLINSEMKRVKPDVILLDAQSVQEAKGDFGLLWGNQQAVPFIVLAESSHEDGFIEAVSNGAAGYVVQKKGCAHLLSTIRQCADGQMIYPLSFKQTLMDRLQLPLPQSGRTKFPDVMKEFSNREKDLLRLLLEGHTNQQMADELFLSIGTVKNYISKIYKKLNVNSRPELMAFLYESGLCELHSHIAEL